MRKRQLKTDLCPGEGDFGWKKEDSHINEWSNLYSHNMEIKNAGWKTGGEDPKMMLRNTLASHEYGWDPVPLRFGTRTEDPWEHCRQFTVSVSDLIWVILVNQFSHGCSLRSIA